MKLIFKANAFTPPPTYTQLFLIFVLIFSLTASQSFADVEINSKNFPDENFRKCISADFDNVFIRIDTLDLSGCTALVSLDCSINNLTKLDVSDCTALQYIDCSQNSLTMLDLSDNTALTSATCINQKATEQKVTKSGNTYKFDFSTLIPSENISQIVGDTVHGYTNTGGTIETTYSDGVATFAYIPYIEGTLPDGLSFDTKTAAITGTPLEECTDRKIKITASNMAGDDSKEFYLNVKGVAAAITTKSLPSGAKNTAYSTPITYTGTAPITLTATGLPSGLELVDGVITGSPTEGGTFNVVITASNNTKTVTKKFKLQINEPPFFNDTSLKDATAGKSYSHKFNVTGTKTIKFKLSNGSLPSGLALNAKNGTLKGKPTAAGDFAFTITATNAQGYSSKEFNLSVKGVAPKISGSLKKGKVGQSYTATLKATGTSPITWIFDGELPDGIDFSNGTFRGTPTEAFDGYVSVSAVNSGGTDTKNLRL